MARPILRRSARTRPLESLNPTWLGFTALLAISVVIAAMLLINVAHVGYRHVTAEFLQAAALKTGNPISVAGIPVGKVTSMKLVGDHVEAGLQVRNDVALGADSKAIIKITTILGSRYLALEPHGNGALPNDTFDLAHTEVPYDLQEALADVTDTYEQVDTDRFAQSLAVLGKQLAGLPPIVPKAMQNVYTLSKIMSERRDQLGTLLKSTDQVSTTLRRQQSNIGAMMNQGQDLISQFVARSATFHAMMQALTHLVESLTPILVDNRGDLDATLNDLRQLSDMLGQHDDLLRSTLQSAPVALRGLANASGSGNAFDLNAPNGLAVDSWMCAISGRAKQFGMIEYFKDCK
jgi:virulence factor Mce-like protein